MGRASRFSAVWAVLTAGAVLCSATFAANQILSSELYTQSRLIGRIVQQGHLDLSDMSEARRTVDLLFHFAGAVTSAYIDFELIPVNETNTFLAIFRCLPADVTVDRFAYRGHDLLMDCSAPDEESYLDFLSALQEDGYFAQVSGETQPAEDGTIAFSLECIAQSSWQEPVFSEDKL